MNISLLIFKQNEIINSSQIQASDLSDFNP